MPAALHRKDTINIPLLHGKKLKGCQQMIGQGAHMVFPRYGFAGNTGSGTTAKPVACLMEVEDGHMFVCARMQ